MRHANRALGALLAVLLGGAAALVIIEVVAHLVGSAPVVLPWDRLAAWGDATAWTATSIRLYAILAVVIGVVLLILELRPAPVERLAATGQRPGVDTGYTRRGVAAAARAAAERVDGVADADVTVKRGALRVTATSAAHDSGIARGLTSPVTAAVQQQLDELQLQRPLGLSVTTRSRRR